MSTGTIEKTETSTDALCARYKRNAKREWVIFGPESLVAEGSVTVTRKNGTTSIANVQGVGKSFLVDGVAHRYGYLEPRPAAQEPAAAVSSPKLSEQDFMPEDFTPGDDVADPADWE